MTGAELVDRTQQLLANRASTTLTDAWYLDRVNDAYRWLVTFDDRTPAGRRSIRFAEFYDQVTRILPASPTTNFIANSANVYSVIGIWDTTNARQIQRKGARFIMSRDPAQEGRVLAWSPSGSDESGTRTAGYWIWKKPDVATTIIESVYLKPEALANGAVAPVIDATWHPVIYMKAAAYGAQLEGLDDAAVKFHQQAVATTRDLRLPDEDSRAFGVRRFGVMERI